jgi:hypothetical protein
MLEVFGCSTIYMMFEFGFISNTFGRRDFSRLELGSVTQCGVEAIAKYKETVWGRSLKE